MEKDKPKHKLETMIGKRLRPLPPGRPKKEKLKTERAKKEGDDSSKKVHKRCLSPKESFWKSGKSITS
jgi:hypothetical protein